MLLSPFYGWVLYMVITILFLLLFVKLVGKKLLKADAPKSGPTALVIIFFVITFPIVIILAPRKAYIINSRTEHKLFFVIGPSSFTFRNGSTADVDMSTHYQVINNYDQKLQNEPVQYSRFGGSFFADVITIEPYTVKTSPGAIDFYPDEKPDSTAPTSGNEDVTKYWVHEIESGQ